MGGVEVEEGLGVGQGGGSQTDHGNTQDMIDALIVTSQVTLQKIALKNLELDDLESMTAPPHTTPPHID